MVNKSCSIGLRPIIVMEEGLCCHVLAQVKAAEDDRWTLMILDGQLGERKE